MVTFDAAEPGTTADEWRTGGRLEALPALDPSSISRLVVVAAHPDDETLGAGALIAECATRGTDITIVVVSDGAASHPSTGNLAATRHAELLAAIAVLAPAATVTWLGFPDGGLLEIRDAIAPILRAAIGDHATIVAPWRGDGHRDHRVVGELCAEIGLDEGHTLVEYPVWMWHWGRPDHEDVPWDSMFALYPGEAALSAKAEAIAAYSSQITREPAMLTSSFLEHFHRPEEFFIVTPPMQTLGTGYFDDLYNRRDDPWRLATRWYEERKRAVTMASLPVQRAGTALEIGCSIGMLTEQLATRCDSLLAVEISTLAADTARARVADHNNVTVIVGDVTTDFPTGPFDLIVLSEVGYYLDPATLESTLDDIESQLSVGGTVLACHWRHPVADYPQGGDEVHRAIAARQGWSSIAHHLEPDFVLDVFSTDRRSVGAREGLS